MGLYEVPLPMSLLGFGMGTMLSNFHMCGIMLVLRALFNMLVRNASPRGCLMFNLSGPCELLFCGECYVLVLCALLCWCICLSCVLRVCELFSETIHNNFGCGCYFVVVCYGCV